MNLAYDDYPLSHRTTAPEMAIVVAASIAVHLAQKRQALALTTNGRDPLRQDAATPGVAADGQASGLKLRKGREQVMHILDLLARVEPAQGATARPFLDLVCEASLGLPWGSTAVLITAVPDEGLFDTLLVLRRRGLGVLLVLTCPHRDQGPAIRRAAQIGVQAFAIEIDRDMDVWR